MYDDMASSSTLDCDSNTNVDSKSVSRIDRCTVCGNDQLETVISLPNLPLTGLYSRTPASSIVFTQDQELLICRKCGHGQARYQVDPLIQYNSEYSFRTSTSIKAKKGTDVFLSVLKRFGALENFHCILDVGCNDLYLLNQFRKPSQIRCGIDPIWKGHEETVADESLTLAGEMLEDTDLFQVLKCPPDLILLRHTMEHFPQPREVLRNLLDIAAKDALFLIEVPNLDTLISRLRFDQVFHQHLQYFNRVSLISLIKSFGFSPLGFFENYHDWGSLIVAFRKNVVLGETAESISGPFTCHEIATRYSLFQRTLRNTADILSNLTDVDMILGYGAAQMLPVLAYHLGSDLSVIRAILDDNVRFDGWHYQNLPCQIIHPSKLGDFTNSGVLVTAMDNVEPIMTKLLAMRPKHILLPLNCC